MMKASALLSSLVLVACSATSDPESAPQPQSPAASAPAGSAGESTGPRGPGRPQPVDCDANAGECRSDADCGSSAVCGCNVGDRSQHVCLTQSRCKVDADCPGETCSLSLPFVYSNLTADGGEGRYGGVTSGSDVGGFSHNEALGYFCTTTDDECVPGAPTNAVGDCVFGLGKNHWVVGSKP